MNSISAHNYAKLSLLRAYLAFHKFDMICLSETCLNSSNLPNVETLEISGYNLVRSDHPRNSKRGGVLHMLLKLPTLTNYQRQLFIRMFKFGNNDWK